MNRKMIGEVIYIRVSDSCNNVAPPPSVVSGYGKRSINLNKVVANFEKHIFLSQTDLTRTWIISNCYNEMFEASAKTFTRLYMRSNSVGILYEAGTTYHSRAP
jgi:hypothetical protein